MHAAGGHAQVNMHGGAAVVDYRRNDLQDGELYDASLGVERAAGAATFRRLAVRGFAPVARLNLERNRSTMALYACRRVAVELGPARAF